MVNAAHMGPRRKGTASVDAIGAGVAVVTLIGEFHHRETRQLERVLREALGEAIHHLVIDMRAVVLFGAPALRVLVRAALRARGRHVGFVLVRPNADVWEAFELTGLDLQLRHGGSLDEALARLSED